MLRWTVCHLQTGESIEPREVRLTVSPSTAIRYQQSDPDVRLMLRVKEDDAGAFEALVRRYEARLVRLMQHLGPRPDMAEDLTQETFLRVYRARKTYVPGAKFSTWLFTIAGNVARNASRSIHRRQEVNEADAPRAEASPTGLLLASTAMEASGLMPVRVAEGQERAEVVRAAVATLSDRQRMALILSRFENLSYAEIAETMGLTTKAVKSLLSRARVNLKEILQPYVDAGDTPPPNRESEFGRQIEIQNFDDDELM